MYEEDLVELHSGWLVSLGLSREVRSLGVNEWGELRGKSANPGSPGKMTIKMERVCVWGSRYVCFHPEGFLRNLWHAHHPIPIQPSSWAISCGGGRLNTSVESIANGLAEMLHSLLSTFQNGVKSFPIWCCWTLSGAYFKCDILSIFSVTALGCLICFLAVRNHNRSV